jgi:hypothetical protein
MRLTDTGKKADLRYMEDDENKPGVTQIPLIHDPATFSSLLLKTPDRHPRPSQHSYKKKRQYPPGYDPDTDDLFKDILGPVAFASKDRGSIPKPTVTQRAYDTIIEFEERLRAALIDDLKTILKHLKDQPET